MNAVSIFTKLGNIDRLRQVVSVLARYGFGHLIEKTGLRDSPFLKTIIQKSSYGSAPDSERLRRAFEELGPTFIKLGQILSTRPDLVPPDYVEEFSKLQDGVPPFSFEEVTTQIMTEFGSDLEELFTNFDPKPIASASLSQVHRASLKDGTQVAVKIQRPGIKPIIESDIELLYLLARMAENRIPELSFYAPRKVVREFERAIMRELDFTIEAANAERFRRNFTGDSEVYFPVAYGELSGKRVLTMDLIEGVKITSCAISGYDPEQIARCGLRAVILMIFRDGFFHADPHPGNVFVMRDGRLAYLDLGLAGRVGEDVRDKMLLLLLAVIREDFEEVAGIFYKIGIKERDVEMSEFRADVVDICEKHFGKPLKYMELSAFLKEILEGAFRHRIRIPHEYALMCKALITMEGVGKRLDPDINIFKESHPYLVEIFKRRYEPTRVSKDVVKAFIALSEIVQEAPPQIRSILDRLESGRFKIHVEDKGNEKMAITWENLINRLIIGAIASGLSLASAFLLILGESSWATLFSVLGFLSSGFLVLCLIYSILKSGRF